MVLKLSMSLPKILGDHLISNDVEGGDAQYMFILSAGSEDRQLRGTNVVRDVLSGEFSQGMYLMSSIMTRSYCKASSSI